MNEEKVWIAVDCFERKLKIYLEPSKFDSIYSDDDIQDFFTFKKEIEKLGGEIKDYFA